jgi:BirA family biotin operon repressor/biotin-[acetyl-CoA-carboxylase] ligase
MHKDFLLLKYDYLDSTQTEAKRLIDNSKANHGVVISTELQTNGRGKYDRVWINKKGDLAFTIILRPNNFDLAISQLSYIAAVAVGRSISLPDVTIGYKWVNDIMLNNKKVCGILLENYAHGFVLVGIGINILSKINISDLNAIGISDINIKINSNLLLRDIVREFFKLYNEWCEFGFKKIRNLWLEKAIYLNQEIEINIFDQSTYGTFLGIDEIGNLELLQNNGEKRLICAGDIFLYNAEKKSKL